MALVIRSHAAMCISPLSGLCCVSYLVGGRDAGWAKEFMNDCASRIKGHVQVTTDGHRTYLEAVEGAFGMDCDYAMLQKIYGAPTGEEQHRYSPGC